MTGFYVRIQRDGKWENIEIDQLTNDELDQFAERQADDGWRWAKALAKWIRDNVGDVLEFDRKAEEEI